jgi:hypothetical protein
MAIVTRGLGLPEDGAIVAGGLGTAEVNANAMAATLTGSSTLVATLTATGSPPPPTSGGGGVRSTPIIPRAKPVNITACLSGRATIRATLTYTINFDAELEQLLLVGAL